MNGQPESSIQSNINRALWTVAGIILALLLGLADYLTGYELSFSLFYLAPIALVTWYAGRAPGAALAVIGAMVWLAADVASRHYYSHPAIYFWNTAIRLGVFAVVTLLLSALKRALEHEKHLARTDPLTGAANSRYFMDLLGAEVERANRYANAFSLAYLDCDDFKAVNDRFGHETGDEVLQIFVETARRRLRATDSVGRLGGDEFAILLPETDHEAAQQVMSRVQSDLLDTMQARKWPVTFSIGVLTCGAGACKGENLVKIVDDLMYSVKQAGKNNIDYAIYIPQDSL